MEKKLDFFLLVFPPTCLLLYLVAMACTQGYFVRISTQTKTQQLPKNPADIQYQLLLQRPSAFWTVLNNHQIIIFPSGDSHGDLNKYFPTPLFSLSPSLICMHVCIYECMYVYEQCGRFWNFGKNVVDFCKQSITGLSRKTLEDNNAKSCIKSEGPAQEVSGGNLTILRHY